MAGIPVAAQNAKSATVQGAGIIAECIYSATSLHPKIEHVGTYIDYCSLQFHTHYLFNSITENGFIYIL